MYVYRHTHTYIHKHTSTHLAAQLLNNRTWLAAESNDVYSSCSVWINDERLCRPVDQNFEYLSRALCVYVCMCMSSVRVYVCMCVENPMISTVAVASASMMKGSVDPLIRTLNTSPELCMCVSVCMYMHMYVCNIHTHIQQTDTFVSDTHTHTHVYTHTHTHISHRTYLHFVLLA
jgi:hypothetical protein